MNRIAASANRIVACVASLGAVCLIAFSGHALGEQRARPPDRAAVVRGLPDVTPTLLQTPLTEPIDIFAQPALGNRLAACHLAGDLTLWVSRPLRVLDDMLEEQAVIEAGLLQFGGRSKLEGCLPDGATLDLSEQFANFVVTEGGAHHRATTMALASQLAQDFFHFAHPDGTLVPLVAGIKVTARGSVAHEFMLVLIRDAKSASFDAVIFRETVRTKFSPRLPETDRRLSRVKWSSIRQD